jgi:hypothetical protein
VDILRGTILPTAYRRRSFLTSPQQQQQQLLTKATLQHLGPMRSLRKVTLPKHFSGFSNELDELKKALPLATIDVTRY